MKTLQCKNCKKEFSLHNFQKDRRRKSGCRQPCKSCLRARKSRKVPIPIKEEKTPHSSFIDLTEQVLKNTGTTLQYHKHLRTFELSIANPHIRIVDDDLLTLLEKAQERLRDKQPKKIDIRRFVV